MVIGIHDVCWEETNEKCNFPAINVVEENLKCDKSNKIIYQGRIIGTRNASPQVILDYINKWILFSSYDSNTISIQDDDNVYALRVDETCSPHLASPLDSNCTPELNMINVSDALTFIAIVLMIILMTILTMAHFINALKQNEINSINHRYKYIS